MRALLTAAVLLAPLTVAATVQAAQDAPKSQPIVSAHHATVLSEASLDRVTAGDFGVSTFAFGQFTSVSSFANQLPGGLWQVGGSSYSCAGAC